MFMSKKKNKLFYPILLVLGSFIYGSITYAGILTRASTSITAMNSAEGEPNDSSSFPSMSADGRFVAFSSSASNLVENDNNGVRDIFLRDRLDHSVFSRININNLGQEANDNSELTAISAHGEFVAFASSATNLVDEATSGYWNIYVHNRHTNETKLASMGNDGNEANGDSLFPSISANGRFVVFFSLAQNLVSNDNNHSADTFVHDLQTGETIRVSVDSSGNEANNSSFGNVISSDGRYVSFSSWASNLVADDHNNVRDIFVHDLNTSTTTRVSVDSNGNEGNGDSSDHISNPPSISANGRFVAFNSRATNLVPNDSNGVLDIFVHDRLSGETTRASIDSEGNESNDLSTHPSISTNGRFISFTSAATNLVDIDLNGATKDIFVHDRQRGATIIGSIDTRSDVIEGTQQGFRDNVLSSISTEGQFIVFTTTAGRVIGDQNNLEDVLISDRRKDDPSIIKVLSDSRWVTFHELQAGWEKLGFNDTHWNPVLAPYPFLSGFPPGYWILGTNAHYMWDSGGGNFLPNGQNGPDQIWLRRSFTIPEDISSIVNATVTVAADDDFDFYVNGALVHADWNGELLGAPYTIDIKSLLIKGKNVFAMYAKDSSGGWEWALVDATIEVEFKESIEGDLNEDDCVDRADLSLIFTEMRSPAPHDSSFDLNGDSAVNIADARKLVTLFSHPRGVACQ